jgi:hypothetical protein
VAFLGCAYGARADFQDVVAGVASTAALIGPMRAAAGAHVQGGIPAGSVDLTRSPGPAIPPKTTHSHAIPERCYQWQRQLTAEAHTVFGLGAPIPVLAAQIEAESGCRPDVHSAYASGLTEFTPETAADIAARYPAILSPAAPMDPRWAIAAQVRYMRELTSADRPARTDCDRWAFGFSAYNGGDAWLRRDQRLCTASTSTCDWQQWFLNVERFSARSSAALIENRTYVRRILIDYAPGYAGWGSPVACMAR